MQIDLLDWPQGLNREIATLERSTTERALQDRLLFERGEDDLDSYSAAVLSLSGTVYAIQLYDNTPTGNFVLITMEDSPDDTSRLTEFLT